MEIVKTSENKESVYELVFDKEQIRNLRYEIIKNCSISVRVRHRVEATTHEGAKDTINSLVDSIGNKIYENVTDIREEQVNDPFDYWRHGDPVPYSFEVDILVNLKLVVFLNNLVSGEDRISLYGYEYFKERKELSEKTKLAMEINEKDYEKLSSYYDLAEQAINLELVQETIKYKRMQ